MNNHILFEENKESTELVVYFSSASSNKSFEGYNLMSQYEQNKLFIRDPYRTWYHGSKDGALKTVEDHISCIKSYIENFDTHKITFIGASMGGYAALLFGSIFNVGKIIAFSPQIILNSKVPFTPNVEVQYDDISSVIKANNSSNIDIWFGEEEPVDFYQIYHIMSEKKINFFPVKDSAHNVLFFFKTKFVLHDLYDFYFKNKKLDFPLHNSNYMLKKSALFLIMKKTVEAFYIEDNPDKAISILEETKLISSTWAGAYYFKGLIYIKQNKDNLAALAFKQTIFLQPSHYDAAFFLGSTHLRLRNDKLAEIFLQHTVYHYPKAVSKHYSLLANAQWYQGKDEIAKTNAKTSLKYDAKDIMGNYIIARIYSKNNEHILAIKHLEVLLDIKPNWNHVKELLSLEYKSVLNPQVQLYEKAKIRYEL